MHLLLFSVTLAMVAAMAVNSEITRVKMAFDNAHVRRSVEHITTPIDEFIHLDSTRPLHHLQSEDIPQCDVPSARVSTSGSHYCPTRDAAFSEWYVTSEMSPSSC